MWPESHHLYNATETSGTGLVSCASCHVDARMDRLAWDLGDPSGDMQLLEGNLGANAPGLNTGFEDWHPMKGPMLTQTMQDIIGKEPHHWRGDRTGIEAFNPAFEGLLGDDEMLTPTEMQEFEDFLATIYFPPNPYRNIDNTRPVDVLLPDGRTGSRNVDSMNACIECHLEGGSRAVNRRIRGASPPAESGCQL